MIILKISEKYVERPYAVRKFKCIQSFVSEGRECIKGNIYIAKIYGNDYVKFIFENGDMNFSIELFNRTMEAWDLEVLEEIV